MAELKVYTMEEVSEILSISIKTVYKYIHEGLLPAVRVGKYWRITEDGLREFLTRGTSPAKKEPKKISTSVKIH